MSEHHMDPIKNMHVIHTTLKNVRRHLFYSSGPVYRIWAIAWFVGFMATFVAESAVWNIRLPGELLGCLWALVMTGAGMYTFLFYRRHPIDADYRKRFALVWLIGFTFAFLTVWGQTVTGVPLASAGFAVISVHTLAIIYLVTGAVLLDGLQIGVGIGLGSSNIVALQLGFPNYTLAMGLMLGIGLMIAGYIEDHRRNEGNG